MRLLITLLTLSLSSSLLAFEIPFSKSNWDIIEYQKIKPNKTSFDGNRAQIKIDHSAGSIIHTLKKPTTIKNLKLDFSHRGNLRSKLIQGNDGFDDYLLRVGIIYEGEKTLNFFERSFAADWLIKVFDKAPKGSGLSQIRFYNVVSDKRIIGKERISPASKYMYEVFKFPSYEDSNSLKIDLDLDTSKKVIAIWLCFDGDDSKSQVEVNLSNLILE
jgi:hypothetical protein